MADIKKEAPNSPLFADNEGMKPKRTQGLKIIIFSVLVVAVVIFLVINALSVDQTARRKNDTGPARNANISNPSRIREELLAAAANAERYQPITTTVDTLPVSTDIVVSAPKTTDSTSRVIVVQPRPQQVRRPRELSQAERETARKYSDMRQQSLASPSNVGQFGENSRLSGGASTPPSLQEQLLMQYMGQMGKSNANPTASGMQAATQDDMNAQQHKLDFLTTQGGSRTPQGYSESTRHPQLALLELKAGTVIPGLLLVGVNSDLPGTLIGQVSENVYDSATGRYLLIPQGSRIMGVYDSKITHGQSRVAIVWNRLIYPDGSTLNIAGSPGADMAGYSGMKGKVKHHYGELLTAALFTSFFISAAETVSPSTNNNNYNKSPKEVLAETTGITIANIGAKLAERALDRQPTIMIKPGSRFNVLVTQDVVFTYAWDPVRTRVASFD